MSSGNVTYPTILQTDYPSIPILGLETKHVLICSGSFSMRHSRDPKNLGTDQNLRNLHVIDLIGHALLNAASRYGEFGLVSSTELFSIMRQITRVELTHDEVLRAIGILICHQAVELKSMRVGELGNFTHDVFIKALPELFKESNIIPYGGMGLELDQLSLAEALT